MTGTGDYIGLQIPESQPKDKLEILSDLSIKLEKLKSEKNDDDVNRIIRSLSNSMPDVSIETLEEVLKIWNEKAIQIGQQEIPALLDELGFSEIKLQNGKKITVSDQVKASCPESDRETLIAEMAKIEAEYRNISIEDAILNVKGFFKESLKSEYSDELANYLLNSGVVFEHKLDIHYQTLNKYVRDNMSNGLPIPESIKVFQYRDTKIK